MKTPSLSALAASAALGLLAPSIHAQEARHPADRWELAFEAGYLKKIRNNSSLDYVIAPAQLAWRSPAALELWHGKGGERLTVRHRVAVIYESYLKGGEDYYFAFAGAPSIELWNAAQKSALFFEIGGGAGLTNSRGVAGGQGQDFTFNWFSQFGVRHQFDTRRAFTAAGYFTHHSNLGMTDPNPGIDVLGVNLGMVWQFD